MQLVCVTDQAFEQAGVPVVSYFGPASAMQYKLPDQSHFTAEAVIPVVQDLLGIICEGGGTTTADTTGAIPPFYPSCFNRDDCDIEDCVIPELQRCNHHTTNDTHA